MTARNITNSDFYQIVNTGADQQPTSILPQYLPIVGITAGTGITASNTAGNWTISVTNPTPYGNANVAAYLPTYTGNTGGGFYTGNIRFSTGGYNDSNVTALLAGNITTGNIATGNITAGGISTDNYRFANGAPVPLLAGYGNANVAAYLPTYTGSLAGVSVTNLREPITISATVPSGTLTANLAQSGIYYWTGVKTSNVTVNFTGVDTITTGNVVSATLLLTNGASPGLISTVQVNGVNITPSYFNGLGTANTSGIDVYTYNLIRTGSTGGAWTVIGSRATTT